MHFYLLSLLAIVGAVLLTWLPKLASNPIGILDIVPSIFQSAQEIFGKWGNALGIFVFAFFLYAVLESRSVQALFAAKKNWLQKKGLLTVVLITVISSFLASGLSWYDEFIHFYPLAIPLMLAMGFDTFGALLCLYGGSSAGQAAKISNEAYSYVFGSHINKNPGLEGKGIHFTGNDGIVFRVIAWLLLTTIVVLFNIWYCNKIFRRVQVEEQVTIKNSDPDDITRPKLTRVRKLILALFIFFVGISIAGQFPKISEKWKHNGEISQKITSSYQAGIDGTGKEFHELGAINEEETMKIAKMEENKKEKFWPAFGKWGDLQIYSWFIIGGIVICLLSKQNIFDTLVISVQNTIPLILGYILMQTLLVIVQNSEIIGNLGSILPSRPDANIKYLVLFGAFLFPFLINLFVPHTRYLFISTFAPLLYAFSKDILLYGAITIIIGSTIASTFSPFNTILQISLQENKVTYREFLKKTWLLGLTMFLSSLLLVSVWIFSIKKG